MSHDSEVGFGMRVRTNGKTFRAVVLGHRSAVVTTRLFNSRLAYSNHSSVLILVRLYVIR